MGWFKKAQPQNLTDFEKKITSLSGSLKVNPILSSNIISVSLESPYKKQVAEVLNKVLDIYIDYRKNTFSLGNTEKFYDKQKSYYAKQLTQATKELKAFNQRWQVINMETQTTANLALISQFQQQLKNLEIEIAENQARTEMLKKGLKIRGSKLTLSKDMRSLPVIVELARGLVPLLIKRTEISKTFTKQSREFKQINAQIEMLRQEIKDESISASRTNELENETLK